LEKEERKRECTKHRK
jgi:hypothetical protein